MPGLEDLLAAALARYGMGPGAGGLMPQAAMGFADEGAPGGVLGGAEDMTPYRMRPRIQITPDRLAPPLGEPTGAETSFQPQGPMPPMGGMGVPYGKAEAPPAPPPAIPPPSPEFFGLPASTITEPGLAPGKLARPGYVIEPRLSEQQIGPGAWAPEGAQVSDAGQLSYPGGQPIPIVPRPGMLPLVKTPEGPELVMPKLADLLGYIIGGPVPAGGPALGSGMIRGRPGVPAIAEGATETAPMAGPAANLPGMSQEAIKAALPPPMSAPDRAWQNYGRNMRPEDVLGSEAVWGAANQAAEQGAGRAEGFAAAANDLWRRMGANQYITPELAQRYIAVEEARARGIGAVPGTVLGAGSTGERGTAAQAASLAAGIENRASLGQALEGAPASPQGVLGGIPGAAQQEAARGAMPPAVVAGAEAAPAAEAAARTGRQEAITAVNLREMPLDEAMRIAATERHLIPSPRGGYVGAPNGVETPADIARMRAEFDRQVEPPGSGAVTRELERVMSAPEAPAVLAKLDADPRIRQAALDRIDHSAEVAARTGQPVREDLQLARKIIAEQGLSGLFAARRAGVAVPAVLGAVLLPAFASEYGKGAK